MPTEAPNDHSGAGHHPVHPGAELGFRPVNDLEHVLLRCVLSGARATLLRALARSTLCVPALEGHRLDAADSGGVRLPCVADTGGRHALVYTSYRQMALAHGLAEEAAWTEVPVGTLFEKWPPDVDAWLNGGGELGFPLDPADIATVADLAAGLEVDEAYEIGPDDAYTDFPGPAVPDQVDCAVVLALFDVPEVLEVLRVFRRLEEPAGRTWRILLVLADPGAGTGAELAQHGRGRGERRLRRVLRGARRGRARRRGVRRGRAPAAGRGAAVAAAGPALAGQSRGLEEP